MSRASSASETLGMVTHASSIALVGASPTNGVALNIVAWNRALGSKTTIHPIHPTSAEFCGLQVAPSLGHLDSLPDVVAVALGSERARRAIEDAIEVGLPTIVVYSDLRPAFDTPGAYDAWNQRVHATGTTLIGPNCMGTLSPATHAALYSGEVNSFAVPPGNVGIVSQSGAIIIGLLAAAPRLQFSHLFSAGNEMGLGMAEYLKFLADDPSTRCIGLFIESIREPQAFESAMHMAAEAGKAVVALVVGRSPRAKENVATHSGALAGEQRVLDAFLGDLGVLRVTSFSEFTETLVALRQPRRPHGRRAAMVHLSGGEASLQLDLAADGPIEFPRLSEATRQRVASAAPWLASAENPLDAWGPPSFAENYRVCLSALATADEFDFIIANQGVAQHISDRGPTVGAEVAAALAEFAAMSAKPVVLLSTLALGISEQVQSTLASAGIPLLSGDAAGIRAIECCIEFDEWRKGHDAKLGRNLVRDDARPTRNFHDRAHSEQSSSDMLVAAGLRRPRFQRVRDLAEALAAADLTGYPVVLKANSPNLVHKTELGAVALGITDSSALEREFAAMTQRLQGITELDFLVVEQVTRHREFMVGAHRDPDFGMVILLGMGGVMAEILNDTVLAIPPVSVKEARGLIDRLRCRAWLDPWRHLDGADVDSLAEFVADFSTWVSSHHQELQSVDINPVAVLEHGRGCLFLDALIVPRVPPEVSPHV